jgi:hypothetical protein
MAHGLRKALVATAITAATLPSLAQQDVEGEYESGTEVSGAYNSDAYVGSKNEVGGNDNTNEVTNYAMQYQHRTDDGQPLYSLQYDHLLKGPSCTETSRGMECNADVYMNGRPADAPIHSDVPISSVIATLST